MVEHRGREEVMKLKRRRGPEDVGEDSGDGC
jgi:hypothetical protein